MAFDCTKCVNDYWHCPQCGRCTIHQDCQDWCPSGGKSRVVPFKKNPVSLKKRDKDEGAGNG